MIKITAELKFDKEVKEIIKKEEREAIPRLQFALAQFLDKVAQVAQTQFVPVRTGRLQASIRSFITKTTLTTVSGVVGTNVEYGKFIEFGHKTRGGKGFVKARPFLVPAFEKTLPELSQFLRRAFSR